MRGPTLRRRRSLPSGTRRLSAIISAVLLAAVLTVGLASPARSAPSIDLKITKLALDRETVLVERTVNYRWLMDPQNIPVMGDGSTHYYNQGPVFLDAPDEVTEQKLRWNEAEDTNIRDMGAVKGTNVRDLCELVGGMADGDTLRIVANDGFARTFAYDNVYAYSEREGPMVVCWYRDGALPDDGFSDGMRLIWFADQSSNPWRQHIFGNWDWHQAADQQYWYYFQNGGEKYPTTSGLSVQRVAQLVIYSNLPATTTTMAPVADFTANRTEGVAPLTISFTDQSSESPTSWSWDFDNDGQPDSTAQSPSHVYALPGVYSVRLSVRNQAGVDAKIKEGLIKVSPAQAGSPAGTPDTNQLPTDPTEPGPPDEQRRGYLRYVPLLVVTMAALGLFGIRRTRRGQP